LANSCEKWQLSSACLSDRPSVRPFTWNSATSTGRILWSL
jgi:hypothetical protein